MSDRGKTKQQLIDELSEMRRQISQLEESEEERKRLLAELQESEEIRSAVTNATPDFIAIVDNEMVIRTINGPMAQRFGKHPIELVGTHGLDLVPPELAESRKQYFDKVLQTGQTFRWEDENRGIYFDNIAFPARVEDGHVTRIALIARDITERKQAEEALKASEQELAGFIESATDGLVIFDSELRLLKINQRALDMWGITHEGEIGKHILELSPDLQKTGRYDAYLEVIRTGIPITIEDIARDTESGTTYLDLRAFKVGEGLGLILSDATERKQTEEALRESEEKFRLLTEKSVVGIYVIQDSKMVYVNPSLAKTIGYEPEEIIGNMTPADIIHPDDIGIAMERLGERFEGKVEDRNTTYRSIKKDGSIICIEVYTMLIDYQGRPAVMGTMIDITDRMQAEEALKESEEKFAKTFYSSPYMAMIGVLADGIFIDINDSSSRILGYTREELIGHSAVELGIFADPEERSRFIGQLGENGYLHNEEIAVYTKSGEVRTLLISAEVINLGGEPCYLAVATDITERRQAEEALKESEEKYRALFESEFDGVAVINEKMEVLLANKAAADMLGFDSAEELLEIDPDIKAIVSSGYSTDPVMAEYRKYGFSDVIAKPYRIRELRRVIRDILQER